MREYTDKELLDRVKLLPSFREIPKGFWILGVQAKEDRFNEYDDKFYLYKGERFIMMSSGTTNAGLSGLLNYNRYNKNGCAVIKTNEWYYDLWKHGMHNGKMAALRQNKPIKYFRDNNKNKRVEELGTMYQGMIGINFHTATYSKNVPFIAKLIGGWSVGCQVINNTTRYYKMLSYMQGQETVSYCLLKEF